MGRSDYDGGFNSGVSYDSGSNYSGLGGGYDDGGSNNTNTEDDFGSHSNIYTPPTPVQNVKARIAKRKNKLAESTTLEKSLRPLSYVSTLGMVMGNFFADFIVRDLKAGGTPVRDAAGNVVGSRRNGILTGRDPVSDFNRDSQANSERDDETAPEVLERIKEKEEETEMVVDTSSGSRRASLIPLRRKSASASSGSGRRSMLGG